MMKFYNMTENLPDSRMLLKKYKQRKQALRHFNKIVQRADSKAIKLFDLINDQTQRQFEFAILLHRIVVAIAIIMFFISSAIVFFPTANSYVQIFSLIGTPISLLTLLIAFLRNPVTQQSKTFESIFRINILFLNFIHRTQNAKLLLAETMAEVNATEFAKLYTQMQEFENIAEETLEKLGKD